MAKMTLSFDNGPEPEVTHHVLDTLAARGIKTTFFLIGKKLATLEGRAAVERAHSEGHWIANHSYTHSFSLGDSDDPAAFDDEVTQCQELIAGLAHPDRYFRPFCNAGIINNRVFKHDHIDRLVEGGYTCVMFDTVTRDWEDAEGWIDRGLTALDERPWTNLILHDIVGYPDGNIVNAMRHLDRFLGLAADRGHTIVQEFEPRTTPIIRGEKTLAMEHLCN